MPTYEDTVRQQGTEIILDYDQCLSVFNNNIERLVSFIENNFLDCGIPIKISTMEKGVSMHWNVILRGLKQYCRKHMSFRILKWYRGIH